MPPNPRKPAARPPATAIGAEERATEALRARIGAGAVTCTIEGRDRYNRALSTCYTTDGTDLNAWLVRQGYALAYRRYSTKYVPEGRPSPGGAGGDLGG